MVLEKTLESPLNCKEIKPVNPKGNPSWLFIGRTGAAAETPIHWLLDAKSWLMGKDADARKDWRQEEKGMTEDEIVGWHHQLNGHEFEQALADSGRGNLICYSPWGCKELDTIEWLKNNWIGNLQNVLTFQMCCKLTKLDPFPLSCQIVLQTHVGKAFVPLIFWDRFDGAVQNSGGQRSLACYGVTKNWTRLRSWTTKTYLEMSDLTTMILSGWLFFGKTFYFLRNGFCRREME